MGAMRVLLVPTLGPLHLLHPRYNAMTLLELTRAFAPDRVLLASYSPEGLAEGLWRAKDELGLFHLLPWAEANGIPVEALGQDAEALQGEAERFREYLGSLEKGKAYLEEAARLDEMLQALLTRPLTPEALGSEPVLLKLRAYTEAVARLFGEGPATGFREARMRGVAKALRALPEGRYVVWVDVLDYPVLAGLLPEAERPRRHEPTEAERHRAVLDRAWRLEEGDDWGGLVAQLQEVGNAEAQYLAAQIYLAAGRVEAAQAILEDLIHKEFQHPAYLPGYVLARLGQVQDLLGDRQAALRAYRTVLALSWAPEAAREIALAGVRTPFRVERG
ncbi:tetratricopeptide repeat protein [Marinithermus hydrothermalis]|uniref:Uncharacterized protein n=1 Tax=Marinithermus hydrothermalis (strain DSM 14884 / JCM 11576 / T1) TaxID=869210 RepID=F2NQQ1_MARHT|nr:hypothetical protein Marky_1530 [Marinithermus hydrothermalis DSM 14884]